MDKRSLIIKILNVIIVLLLIAIVVIIFKKGKPLNTNPPHFSRLLFPT